MKLKNRFAFMMLAAAIIVIGLQSFTQDDHTSGTDGCSTAGCAGGTNFCCQTTDGSILYKR